MSTARQKILNYIVEERSATVEELSKRFQVTPANIRHHLSILTRQGIIRMIGTKPVTKKGRPVQVYSSTQDMDRHNLAALADALLCTNMSNAPLKQNEYLFQIADLLKSGFKIDLTNPTKRLYSTIQALNRMSYQAHWEAHVENPRVMLGRCPYKSILDIHPELCLMDRFLLEVMLGMPVRQVDKQVVNSDGFPECAFLINLQSS
jgi:predicted ArsR family transcriptional regulator